MNTARRAVPFGTALPDPSSAMLRHWPTFDEGAGRRAGALFRGKFAHPIEGFAKCLSSWWAAMAPGTLCIGRSCSYHLAG